MTQTCQLQFIMLDLDARCTLAHDAVFTYSYCTSLFHRLGAGGSPPFVGTFANPLDPGLEFDPSDGAGAGLIGRFMMF